MTAPHRRIGFTVGEFIAGLVRELEIDEVGLWQIVPVGSEDFGLDGPELDGFVREALCAIFKAGAVPVRHIPASGQVWTWQKEFGSNPDEMADAIVDDWVREGRPSPDLGSLWFAMKNALERPFTGLS